MPSVYPSLANTRKTPAIYSFLAIICSQYSLFHGASSTPYIHCLSSSRMSNDGIPGSVSPWDIASRGVGFTPVVNAALGGASEITMGAMAMEYLPEREASGYQRRGCTALSEKSSCDVL